MPALTALLPAQIRVILWIFQLLFDGSKETILNALKCMFPFLTGVWAIGGAIDGVAPCEVGMLEVVIDEDE